MSQAREDLYTGIHKALRAALCEALVRVGSMDVDDDGDRATALEHVRNVVELTRHHLHHENQYVHPLIEARRPGSTAALAREHVEHEQSFERLSASIAQVERARGAAREAAALALYRDLALYAAEDFRHMHAEETEANAALWGLCSDDELRAAHHAIVSNIAPDLMARYVRWLIPAMTPAERVALLSGARASLPPEVFDSMLRMVRPFVGERGWAKLGKAFALPAAA